MPITLPEYRNMDRQCQRFRWGRRCPSYAMKGARFCGAHGGRRQLTARVRIDHLPKFYSKLLSRTLSSAVEEATNCPPQEQLNLFEELALMRSASEQAVIMYDACVCAQEDGTPVQPETVLAAASVMKDWLREVVKVADAAARLEALAKDKVSVMALHLVVNQIIRCAHDAFGDDPRAQVFETFVRQRVRMPAADGTRGTTLTPDLDAHSMDASIPMLPMVPR